MKKQPDGHPAEVIGMPVGTLVLTILGEKTTLGVVTLNGIQLMLPSCILSSAASPPTDTLLYAPDPVMGALTAWLSAEEKAAIDSIVEMFRNSSENS